MYISITRGEQSTPKSAPLNQKALFCIQVSWYRVFGMYILDTLAV